MRIDAVAPLLAVVPAAAAGATAAAPGAHADWLLYAAIVAGVVALPGLDMGVALASTLAGGRRAGFAAIAGIVTGGVGHVALGLLGVSVVLRLVPAAFDVLLLAGAVYVAWIAIGLLRARPEAPAAVAGGAASVPGAYARGLLTNALNPKAYLYTLAILPEFVRPKYGPLLPQAATIVAINATMQVGIYGAVVVLADRGRAAMARRPAIGVGVARVTAALLLAAAAFTAWEGWRGHG